MQITDNQRKVIGQVLMQFSIDVAVTGEAIRDCADHFSQINSLSQDEKDEVVRELLSLLEVRIERGACVREVYANDG